jgi:hypothetical protein
VELPRNVDGYVKGKEDDDIWGIRKSRYIPGGGQERRNDQACLVTYWPK